MINKLFSNSNLLVFLNIKSYNYINLIYMKTSLSMTAIIRSVNILSDMKLITKQKNKRINYLFYTEKGEKIYNILMELNKLFEVNENENTNNINDKKI